MNRNRKADSDDDRDHHRSRPAQATAPRPDRRLWPSVLGLTTAWISFALLAAALRSLPVGTAYAVSVGIGAVGVAAACIIVFGEATTPARLAFLALIVIGVAGLKLLDG